MAHLIDTMAYTGQTPWHGLGNILPPRQSLEIWLKAAGMDWTIEQSNVMFNVATDALHIRPYKDSKVLYRSDTLEPLSVVSQRSNVVQPHEVSLIWPVQISPLKDELLSSWLVRASLAHGCDPMSLTSAVWPTWPGNSGYLHEKKEMARGPSLHCAG